MYELEDVECIAETGLAILCVIEGEEIWIPQSQVSEDSEVYSVGDCGTLIISKWLAKKKGLMT